MDTLIVLHSHMRHLVMLLAALAVVLPGVAALRRVALSKIDVLAVRLFAGVVTLQWLLGLIQLVMRWSDLGDGLRTRLEHAALMTVVVGLVHMSGRWIKAPADVGPRNITFFMLACLLLIQLGIALVAPHFTIFASFM
jgi:hypothetical protein